MADNSGSISLIDFLAAECASVAPLGRSNSTLLCALQSYITHVMCSVLTFQSYGKGNIYI